MKFLFPKIENGDLICGVLTDSEDSDEDMFTVPDVEITAINVHSQPNSNLKQSNVTEPQFQTGFPGKRRRGRNPADKEHRRLKRYTYTLHITHIC